ncbi:histidine kinase N-terminal 7TM domain-containing protein [Leptospira stimsonii]|uniref:Histidine kinase N-terminal 7TM region domain-containing protein n=1 Tax=Leptospira stimsonii TaxID=2202203 RepID=A0ABY2MZN8_9LEPT|nr:histidine kinase N-terminal 7TM domain-containing protein [Leptospira stimsonii]TGK18836.1 hypothetical protein EHO98_12260 [Leptospira stimsonii]TGM12908.1 hypothetical protein EHQ90_14735 [Leptospira stimsonii]
METSVILLFASILNFIIGFYILIAVRQRKEFRDFGILCLFEGAWDVLFSIPFFNHSSTLFWARAMTIPMIFCPLLLVRFIYPYVFNKDLSRICNYLILIGYILPITVFSFTDFYISRAEILNSKLHFEAGLLYDYFVIGGVLSLLYSIFVLCIGIKRRRGMDRVRLVYFAIGVFVWLGFIGTFTFAFKLFGLPEYNFIAPIGCTLATAIWSIGIIKINLFESSGFELLDKNNSLIVRANILILKTVDNVSYQKAVYRYNKNLIARIIQNFTHLQVNTNLSSEEIYSFLAHKNKSFIPLKFYQQKRS